MVYLVKVWPLCKYLGALTLYLVAPVMSLGFLFLVAHDLSFHWLILCLSLYKYLLNTIKLQSMVSQHWCSIGVNQPPMPIIGRTMQSLP